jgi:hypothetical protein
MSTVKEFLILVIIAGIVLVGSWALASCAGAPGPAPGAGSEQAPLSATTATPATPHFISAWEVGGAYYYLTSVTDSSTGNTCYYTTVADREPGGLVLPQYQTTTVCVAKQP